MAAKLVDPRTGTVVYTNEIANLPSNVDVRQQDKVLAKLEAELEEKSPEPDIRDLRTLSADTLAGLATAARRTTIVNTLPQSGPGVSAQQALDIDLD